jgi:hypothetical protein
MKDKELKLEDVKSPHTLGWASSILFEYIDPVEVRADRSLAEVELRKPRNLFVCVSEEREDGERGEREGEVTQTLSLSSGTHRIQNSLAVINYNWIKKRRKRPFLFFLAELMSAYVSIRQHTSGYVSIRHHTSSYVSIRQHTSAYVYQRSWAIR